jgi:ubiquinone biosynthesis O-methyltransferase
MFPIAILTTSLRITTRIIIKRIRQCSTKPTTNTTVDDSELRKFVALSQDWWRTDGPFAALHEMNRVRIPLVRRAILDLSDPPCNAHDMAAPLKGFSILDVGCGGGILSEALARQGATVTGIDAAAENIRAAELHQLVDPDLFRKLNYQTTTVEEAASRGASFDAVIASEVLEHVSDTDLFLESCAGLVRVRALCSYLRVNAAAILFLY